ncbi:CAP-Gly domain-containing linker protein 4-like [Brevipalpus obovatus]|uniref:CAP-Gly domain-containing linker protein 4-like n=1 Tax=Brevipalpus obovatus TaxID=246614 RepID=UPI003D9E6392
MTDSDHAISGNQNQNALVNNECDKIGENSVDEGNHHQSNGLSKQEETESPSGLDSLAIEVQNGLEIMSLESKWSTPKVHVPSDAPVCRTCEQLDMTFFNINCHSCRQILTDPNTSISQLFAILRQWVPQIQFCVELLVKEILKRGANVDDKDGLSDMTLLHYACKAGSSGVGDVKTALRTVHLLISKGADISIRCRWTDMAAIHYAVYFDVSEIVDYLLTISNRRCLDDTSHDFDGGTPLHIAAANLCIDSVKILLKHGVNVLLKDDLDRTALDCVPDPTTLLNSCILSKQGAVEVAAELRALLERATLSTIPGETFTFEGPVTGKVVLQALGLQLGDKVVFSGNKSGVLRYCGAVEFASGIWAGIELEEPEGKHDGTYQSVTYFRCKPNHGIFAPISRICRYDSVYWRKGNQTKVVNYPGIDVSRISPKVETGLGSLKCRATQIADVEDRVILADKRCGIVRYVGDTQFASGTWYGIELSKPIGRNDGSVNGVRYFECKPNHGLFVQPNRIFRVTKCPNEKFGDDDSECSLTLSRSSSDRAKSPISLRRLKSRSSLLKSSTSPPSTVFPPLSAKFDGSSWLTPGVHVFVNGEIAIVRYVGSVEFADGIWLGVELKSATGKNDGSIQGKRYFTCKPNHGLLVRPKRVFLRGINGAQLLPSS